MTSRFKKLIISNWHKTSRSCGNLSFRWWLEMVGASSVFVAPAPPPGVDGGDGESSTVLVATKVAVRGCDPLMDRSG